MEGADRDLILLSGIEPHLGWRGYVGCVLELCRTFDVSGVITLGALLAEVSHVRPVPLIGSSADEDLARRLDLSAESASSYEGPTGVVGVLSQAVRDAGLATASLWASVPFYVNASPNPKGALAILERLNGGLELGLSLHDLEVFAARFDAQVQAEIDKDPQMVEYARRIEEQLDDAEEQAGAPGAGQPPAELPDAEAMVEELERFLREQRGS
jgi:proteasome assembly chaperone (PAC2) family protein